MSHGDRGGGGSGSSSSMSSYNSSSSSNSFKISRGDIKIAPDGATNSYFDVSYSSEDTQKLPLLREPQSTYIIVLGSVHL
jgi:hypothetical protein